jgi:hypothetical protein
MINAIYHTFYLIILMWPSVLAFESILVKKEKEKEML